MLRSTLIRRLKFVGILIIGIIIILYVLSKAQNYTKGPDILITNPINGLSTSTELIYINGQALRVNKIAVNGSPIFIDEAGNFSEPIVLFEGMNNITIKAGDQFGRVIEKSLSVFKFELNP